MDLTKLKSVVVLEDEGLIVDRLQKGASKPKGQLPHTTWETGEGGRLQLRKNTAAAYGKELQVPGKSELEALAKARGLPWEPSLAERVIPWWASDERVDGHGEIVLQNWHFEEFADNPVVPFSHEWWAPPVGNVLNWEVVARQHKDFTGQALKLLTVFATKETWEWADTIFRLLKTRFLRGGSVGFWSAKVIDVTDPEERAQLGLGPWGFILDENHLLEFSPTTIGANPGAFTILSGAKARGDLQARDMLMVRELMRQQALRTDQTKDAWAETCGRVLSMSRALFPKFDFKADATDVGEPLIDAPPEDRELTGAVVVEQFDEEPGNVPAEPTMGQLISALDEGFAALFQMIADIRDRVEAIAGPGDDDEDPEEDLDEREDEDEDDDEDVAPPRPKLLNGQLDRMSKAVTDLRVRLAPAGSSD